MSIDKPPRSKKAEYPPDTIRTYKEASTYVKREARELRKLLEESISRTREDEQQAKDVMHIAKKKYAREEVFIPSKEWYIKAVQKERRRLQKFSKVIERLEQGEVPRYQPFKTFLTELVFGVSPQPKVDDSPTRKLSDIFTTQEIEDASLEQQPQHHLDARIREMVGMARQAAIYQNPDAFMKDSKEEPEILPEAISHEESSEEEAAITAPTRKEAEVTASLEQLPVVSNEERRVKIVDSITSVLEGPPGDHEALKREVLTMINRFYDGTVSNEFAFVTVLKYLRSFYPRQPLSDEEIESIQAEALEYMDNLAANAAARNLGELKNVPGLPEPVIDLFNEAVFKLQETYHVLTPKMTLKTPRTPRVKIPFLPKPLLSAAAFIAATFAGTGTAGQTTGVQRIEGAIPFEQLEQEARNITMDMSSPPASEPTGYAGRVVPADAPPPQTP